jgi:phospholipase/carboxylesterase
LTEQEKKVYSTRRKNDISLRDTFPMKTALFPDPTREQVPPTRTVEKLDLELDFAKVSLPAQTRQTHPHILFSPMHYEQRYAYPLLVWLHGSGGDERQLTRIMPLISMRNYVAVAPRGFPTALPLHLPTLDLSVSAILQRPKEQYDWAELEDWVTIEQRIFDCVTVAQERCNIANHRIFIAGFGTGGTTALRLAMLYPEYFAGAASFGGEIPNGSRVFPSWQMTQPLSVLLGLNEAAPEYVSPMMELFYMAGLNADVREYPDTTLLTSVMLQDLNRWMMQIVCPAASEVRV